MKFNIGKLLFFDIESVSQHKDLYDMSERELETWMKYYPSMRKRVTDEKRMVGLEDETNGIVSKKCYQEVYRQTAAFFPEFGKVACVSMAFVTKGKAKYDSFSGEDELEILKEVRKIFNKVDGLGFDLCGHSIKMFDIPFLGKRFFINGLNPPTLFPNHATKPWEMRTLDTKDVWQFGNNWALGSLDLVCTVLDIDSPKNGDVKGDSVTTNYWDGNHDEIKEYCERDVKALVDMITKLNDLE
jgi:DNA polymerase elongation subunit (family B)